MRRFTPLLLLLVASCGPAPAPTQPVARSSFLVSLSDVVAASSFDVAAIGADARIESAPELEKINVLLVSVPTSDVESAAMRAQDLVGVDAVDPNGRIRLIDPVTVTLGTASPQLAPDPAALDPLVGSQYQHALTRSTAAWDRGIRGGGAVVAIIDTGIDCAHEDLACVPGKDFTGIGNTDDGNGHGTHVAGIAAARAGNGKGGSGIAPDVRVQPVRVLDSGGSGSFDAVAAGIVWAADGNAAVLSMSLGGPEGYLPLERAVNYARGKGKAVVCAAGNSSSSLPFFPASYAGCTGVGATDKDDKTASWSNYGMNAEVAFPGVSILSTCRGSTYCYMSGTSMSAPGYAGAVALCMATGRSADACEADLRWAGVPVTGRLAGLPRANLDAASSRWTVPAPPTSVILTATPRPSEVVPTKTPFPNVPSPTIPAPYPAPPTPINAVTCRVVAVEDVDVVLRCKKP